MRDAFMRLYGYVMAPKEEDLDKFVGEVEITDIHGRIGEAKTALFIAEKKGGSYIVVLRYRLKIEGEMVELDIVTQDTLFDTKYWSEDTFKRYIVYADKTSSSFNRVINRIKNYQLAMKELGKKKVFLVFVKEAPEELFKICETKIRDALEEDTSWLEIVNGLNNLNLEGRP